MGYLLLAPVNSHYFLGIAPLWSVVIAIAVSSVAGQSRIGQRFVLGLAIAVALGGDAYTLYRVRTLGLPPTTLEGRERFWPHNCRSILRWLSSITWLDGLLSTA